MNSENKKFFYKCVNCKKEYCRNEVIYLCPDCALKNVKDEPPKGVLNVIYDYNTLQTSEDPLRLFDKLKGGKYIDLLPIKSTKSLPYLKVGETPLYKQTKLKTGLLPFNLYLKDDSQNPTFSFKDRASALVSAYAKENGINTVIAASTGNAGSSLAGICASQDQKAVIIVPEKAPLAKLAQIVMYGAIIFPIKGTYDDAFDLSIKATDKFNWYNRNTAFNPLTVEGKKTAAFELFDQLGQNIPDRIFVPVGDGVIISGVYKGFEDLLKLGIIEKIPVIVAVQSEGSNNLIENINSKTFNHKPSKTIADSISVDIPRNFYMAKQFLNNYKGEYLNVTDDEIINSSSILSKNTGLFAEPAATAAYAGLLNYFENNKIPDKSDNVVLLTGSGLKDINSVRSILTIPDAVDPEIENLIS